MTRTWHIWTVFILCLAVVLAAMGWASLTVLRLEAHTERQATLEENVRLALWRMESALGPLIAQEGARPYFTYRSFYPSARAYPRMFNALGPEEVMLPSPLLTFESPYILLHFQIGPDDVLTSPQVPAGEMRDLAEAASVPLENMESFTARLDDLRNAVVPETLRLALEEVDSTPNAFASTSQPAIAFPVPRRPRRQVEGQAAAQQAEPPGAYQGPLQQTVAQPLAQRQQLRSSAEGMNRFTQNDANIANTLFLNVGQHPGDVREEPVQPVWVGDALLLARRVTVNGAHYLQGCQLDWPAIRAWLGEAVHDLLPQADLVAVRATSKEDQTRMLAALPLRLIPGEPPMDPDRPVTPIQVSLVIAWICVILAAVAVAGLLVGVVSLSERRGAFVSAVTHEMRTPLTTFRMYAEMLLKGMVPDEAKQRQYLDTLRIEADRLSHLVENVLAYARLERTRIDRRAESVSLDALIGRARSRLEQRAERSGMQLVVASPDGSPEVRVRADTAAVEQILLNLIDNACKYAADSAQKTIHLEPSPDDRCVSLRVRDHGPGIPPAEARRLFRPFSKSARDAANSAPGVGLGLALSRRLARSMGGDLRLDPRVTDGACFVLTLPAA